MASDDHESIMAVEYARNSATKFAYPMKNYKAR